MQLITREQLKAKLDADQDVRLVMAVGLWEFRAKHIPGSLGFPSPRLKRSHADFVAAHEQLARLRMLRYCARRRLACWVWTVDDEKEIARFMADERVTTLITNRPEVALRLRSA